MHTTIHRRSFDAERETGIAQASAVVARRRLFRRSRWVLTGTTIAAFAGTSIGMAVTNGASADSNASVVLQHLNQLRASRGVPTLTMAGDLTEVAQEHSQQMANQGRIFHNPELQTQVANWKAVGENVGEGPTVEAVDNAFDASPDHYPNEVNASYTQVGIGTVTGTNGEIYVTVDFREPK